MIFGPFIKCRFRDCPASESQKMLESLKRLASTDTLLLREGRIRMVPASKVVPGDILVLETGGIAAADGRIYRQQALPAMKAPLQGKL